MNHGFKLHPDGTLEITMPKGKKVGRVLVCEAGTQNGTLMYPDCDDCIKHGGDWECDHVNCHPQNQNGRRGKWIVTSEFEDCRYVKCNQCKVTQVFYYNKPLTNFCPNCGSYMRGEKDD